MQFNPEEQMPFSDAPNKNRTEATNDNVEVQPEAKEVQLSQKLEQILIGNDFKQALLQELKANPDLAKKLSLDTNQPETELIKVIESSLKDLSNNTSHLIKVIELITIIRTDPKKIASVPGKFIEVLGQNTKFMEQFENYIKEQTQSESITKKIAARLVQLNLKTNPMVLASKYAGLLVHSLGFISEDEGTQMEINAQNSTENAALKSWILLQTIKHNDIFQEEIKDYALNQFEKESN